MAIKIMRTTDRIHVKVDEITLIVSALSYQQKVEVQSCGINIGKDNNPLDVNKMMRLVIKYSVKGINGIETIDGSNYELEFKDEAKTELSDNCVEELLSIQLTSQKMIIALMGLIGGIPKDNTIVDPETGEKLKGVEILLKKNERKKP